MKKYSCLLIVTALSVIIVLYSCRKSTTEVPVPQKMAAAANFPNHRNGVHPYQFERINKHNFNSQGWKEQQVNIVSGITGFADESEHIQIVCGPENDSDPRLIQGCVSMNLPTGSDPTLRRIRLRRGGYSGTLLADLTEKGVIKGKSAVMAQSFLQMLIQRDPVTGETFFVTGIRIQNRGVFLGPLRVASLPEPPWNDGHRPVRRRLPGGG